MKEQRKKGKIAFIILLSIAALNFIFVNIFFFRDMLSDVLNQLFLMILYAVIPCVPAVILRAKFGAPALKWIAFAASILGGLCCIVQIALPESILNERAVVYEDAYLIRYSYVNEWIFTFTQNALTSSVAALYCVAFAGDLYCLPFLRRSISFAFAPSFAFCLSLLIRHAVMIGFLGIFEFVFEGYIFMVLISGLVFAVWALLLIFISRMIYKFITRMKINREEKINA